jgi:hypothetical protein
MTPLLSNAIASPNRFYDSAALRVLFSVQLSNLLEKARRPLWFFVGVSLQVAREKNVYQAGMDLAGCTIADSEFLAPIKN